MATKNILKSVFVLLFAEQSLPLATVNEWIERKKKYIATILTKHLIINSQLNVVFFIHYPFLFTVCACK